MVNDQLDFWEKNLPWTFRDVPVRPDYQTRRNMRYDLQDYMAAVIGFHMYKGRRVLEVGSGSGLDACEFSRFGAVVTATDATSRGVFETRATMVEAGLSFPILRMPAEKLDFPSDSFDVVYCFGVLHHLVDPTLALAEFARVLKRDGEVIGMLYHTDSLLNAYSLEHLKLSVERTSGVPIARTYTVSEAEDLFSQYFRDINVSVHYNVVDLRDTRKVKLNISDELQLGWHLIVKGRKP